MNNKSEKKVPVPSLPEIQRERKRIRRKDYYRQSLRGTISVLVVVAAIAVLVATLFLPILQISGDSMSPTLEHDEIVILVKTKEFNRGDLIGFYYQGKILLKRVIALPDDEVAIDAEGNVYVNDQLLDEPYVTSKSLGECDITFPYQVPDGKLFVLGDHRDTSIDSRSSTIGCVEYEQIVGQVLFKIWSKKES